MRIHVFSVGDMSIASSRARWYEFIPYFQQEGIQVKITPFVRYEQGEDKIRNRWVRYAKRARRVLSVVHESSSFDIVVVQRLIFPMLVHRLLRQKSKKMVFDMDDAVDLPLNSSGRKDFYKMLGICDGVITSNAPLKNEVGRHSKKTVAIPTCVNTRRLVPAARKENNGHDKTTIAWIGTPHTEKYLLPMQAVFKRLMDVYSFEIHVISGGNPVLSEVPVRAKKWTQETEVIDLQQADIGIMPLVDGPWERMKSGYKLLQYMAVGIPVVASGVGINRDLVKQGINGFIADTDQEWMKYLSLLIEDRDRRLQMGAAAREFVERNYDHGSHFNTLKQFLISL